MTYIMNKSKSYIVGFCISLIFILIMLHHNSNSSSPALVYTQTYVDSLRYEIQLRDSLITLDTFSGVSGANMAILSIKFLSLYSKIFIYF